MILLGKLDDQGTYEDVPSWFEKMLLETEHFMVHAQFIEDMLWRQHERVFGDWQQAYTSVLLHAERNAFVNHVRVVPAWIVEEPQSLTGASFMPIVKGQVGRVEAQIPTCPA